MIGRGSFFDFVVSSGVNTVRVPFTERRIVRKRGEGIGHDAVGWIVQREGRNVGCGVG